MTATWGGQDAKALTTSALSVAVILPAGIANGDIGYISHTYNPTTGATTTPAGWTLVRTDAFSSTAETKLFRKTLTTADSSTTVTFTNAGSQRMSAGLGILKGVLAEDVVNVRVENVTAPATNTAPTATAGTFDVQMVFWNERSTTPSTAMNSAPTGVTMPAGGAAFGVGSGACSVVVGYDLTPVAPTGTLGGSVWDPDVSNNAVIMYVIGVTIAQVTVPVTDAATVNGTAALQRQSATSDTAAVTDSSSLTIGLSKTDSATLSNSAAVTVVAAPPATVTAPIRQRSFRIEVFDENLTNLGRVGKYISCDLVLKHLAVGTWSLLLDLDDRAAALLAVPGRRVTIDFEDDGTRLLSGPMDSWEEIEEVGGVRTIAFFGYDDTWWLDQRLAYQVPGATMPPEGNSFTQSAHVDIRSGNGETVAKGFVTANAITRFPIPHLVIAPNLGRGTSVSFNARMHSLLWMTTISTQFSGLGFRIDQVGSQLVFDVYEPQDQPVRLSKKLGNLSSYRYKVLSPAATHATVGGAGESTARVYMQDHVAASAVGWGAREKYVDTPDANSNALLQASLDSFLAAGAPTAGFSLSPRDTRAMKFAVHYNKGDRVAVELLNGTTATDTVKEVKLSHTVADGMVITPGIGYSESTDPTAAIYRYYVALRDRVANRERSV